MLKKARVALFACFAVMTCTGSLTGRARALDLPPVTVYLVDDGKEAEGYQTTATTVKEFLGEESANLNLHSTDLIDVDFGTTIEEGLHIVVTRSLPIILKIDDSEEISYARTFTSTVGEFIAEYQEQTNTDYAYKGSETTQLESHMEIHLLTKAERIIAHEEELPFETEVIESMELVEGEMKVLQEGVTGVKVVQTKKSYEAGQEVDSVVILEVTSQEPQNEIIKKGIAPTVLTENGYKKYVQKMTMTATSYTLSFSCTGKRPGDRGYGITASGLPADHGVVAVDPNVIPLGTRLYVEGYCIAIAADTGGAIKGKKIDLFYHDIVTARKFGRQTRSVYILA